MSPRDGLASLVGTLCPGARIVGRRRLRGGLGAVMHVVRYEDPAGERSNVIVRSYITKWPKSTPQRARYEVDVLGLVAKAGISGPRPLLLDAEGEHLGAPSLVLSYLPGRSYFPTRQPSWTEGLAAGLAAVHAVTHGITTFHGSSRPKAWPRSLRVTASASLKASRCDAG